MLPLTSETNYTNEGISFLVTNISLYSTYRTSAYFTSIHIRLSDPPSEEDLVTYQILYIVNGKIDFYPVLYIWKSRVLK